MERLEVLLALLAAVIGLIAAFVNRKQIIVHKYETPAENFKKDSDKGSNETKSTKPKKRITLRKRFKRFLLSSMGSFISLLIIRATANTSAIGFMILAFCFLLMLASYQLIALFIAILRSNVGLKSFIQPDVVLQVFIFNTSV